MSLVDALPSMHRSVPRWLAATYDLWTPQELNLEESKLNTKMAHFATDTAVAMKTGLAVTQRAMADFFRIVLFN